MIDVRHFERDIGDAAFAGASDRDAWRRSMPKPSVCGLSEAPGALLSGELYATETVPINWQITWHTIPLPRSNKAGSPHRPHPRRPEAWPGFEPAALSVALRFFPVSAFEEAARLQAWPIDAVDTARVDGDALGHRDVGNVRAPHLIDLLD